MKVLQTLQKLLIELNQLICKIGEKPAHLIDRFNKITLGVTAIDAAQMPTEIKLIAILKILSAELTSCCMSCWK